MSAPRASDIAARTGVAQSVVHSKTPKIDKKAEEARLRTLGDDEEGDRGPQAGKGGANKSGGAGATQFGQEERQKVKRKKVRLSELQGKKTQATKAKEQAPEPEPQQLRAKANPEEVGRRAAQNRLNEQAKLAETRVRYQQNMTQTQQDPNNSLSPQGVKQRMLNNLIQYQQNNYMQHTGDKAGEIYNRPATRQILQALQGLKNGPGAKTEGTTTSTSTSGNTANLSPAAFKAKTEQANKMLEVFMLADKQPPPGYEPTELVA